MHRGALSPHTWAGRYTRQPDLTVGVSVCARWSLQARGFLPASKGPGTAALALFWSPHAWIMRSFCCFAMPLLWWANSSSPGTMIKVNPIGVFSPHVILKLHCYCYQYCLLSGGRAKPECNSLRYTPPCSLRGIQQSQWPDGFYCYTFNWCYFTVGHSSYMCTRVLEFLYLLGTLGIRK